MSAVRKTTGTNAVRKTAAGLTLIEVLIIVAIIGILAGLLLPSFISPHRQALRTQCLANLKQLDLALLAYGHDHSDRLPRMAAENWLWDLPVSVVDDLSSRGIPRATLHDPGNREQGRDVFWNFGLSNQQPFRVIGYALAFAGPARLPLWKQNLHAYPEASMMSPYFARTRFGPPEKASDRVLAAGVVISLPKENRPESTAAYHWQAIPGPYSQLLRSSHLDRTGKLPVGDNVAMIDGSARWVSFNAMKPRTEDNGPVFWW
jgi:type II secretory pathway pseudopilin PulG